MRTRWLPLAGMIALALAAPSGIPLLDPALAAQQGALQPLKFPARPTGPAITTADLMSRLYQFADDSMGGRATGTRGHLMATDYLAAEARRIGLTPAGDEGSYFQTLPVMVVGIAAGGTVRAAGDTFLPGRDFGALLVHAPRGPMPLGVPVVLGGNLGDSLSLIPAEAAAGKIVVLLPDLGAPRLSLPSLLVAPGSRFAGAAAVVIPLWDSVRGEQRAELSRPRVTEPSPAGAPEAAPTFLVTPAMAEALLRPGSAVEFRLEIREDPAARNVVAILPGSDPALAGQFIALGAHSDHEPIRTPPVRHAVVRRNAAPGPARLDSIMNGADDDGSGSVALLEIAEALAAAPVRPRRSVLFVWHAAEEQGLVGSEWFTTHPTVPIDSIVAQLNLDMVGRGGQGDIRGGGPRYLEVVGARRRSTELGELVDAVNRQRESPFRLNYAFDAPRHPEMMYCRSDHAMYARLGIPVAFFSTGQHPDYHQVTDEPQYIDYAKLAAVAGYVRDLTVAIADRPERLRLRGGRPDPRAPCRQ